MALSKTFRTKDLSLIPRSIGVYEFYGDEEDLLYVGKSVDMRSRIASHFRTPYLNNRKIDLRNDVELIRITETATELGALLYELVRIKTELPIYNKRSRRTRALWVLKEVLTEPLSLELERVSTLDPREYNKVRGVFRSRRKAKQFLERVRSEHELCPKLLTLEGGKGECFYHQIGKCRGVCVDRENTEDYNIRFRDAFSLSSIQNWPFGGIKTVTKKREGLVETIAIDAWNVLAARLEYEKETLNLLGSLESVFEYDVYRVLLRHFQKELNYAFK